MLKEEEEKLYQRYFYFYLLDNLGRILRFWNQNLLFLRLIGVNNSLIKEKIKCQDAC